MRTDALLTYELDAALDFYRSLGQHVEVEIISPPYAKLAGRYRILRIRKLTGNHIILTAAREDDRKEV